MDVLTIEEAEQLIKEILQYGSVIPGPHARERMQERGYSIQDVLYILEQGKITNVEEDSKGNKKYHVSGEDLSGHAGIVVTLLTRRDKMVILTVLGGV